MKKFQLFFFFLLLATGSTFSQCVADTNNTNMFAPPSEELPCVIRNQPYYVALQLFCPPALAGITIDSIKITSFNGMPTGITKLSNPANGIMYPLGRMCINVMGTTNDTVGFYQITYNGFAYTTAGTASFNYIRANLPGALPEYGLSVIDSNDVCTNTTTSIKKYNRDLPNAFSVYPNPNKGAFTFALNAFDKTNGEINVRDITGRVIFSQKTTSSPFYETTIDISQYSKGIYFVEYRTADGYAVKKVSVE